MELTFAENKALVDKPWAKKLLSKVMEISEKGVMEWCSILAKIGETEIDLEGYMDVYIKQVQKLHEELVMDLNLVHAKLLDKIMQQMEEIEDQCRLLKLESPSFSMEDRTLGELKKKFTNLSNEYSAVINSRRAEFKKYQAKELKLYKSLGRNPPQYAETHLPTPDEMAQRIEDLENEKMDREEAFFKIREEIVNLVEQLQLKPSLDFEKEILSLGDDEVRLSDADMESLREFHHRLQWQLTTITEEIGELRPKLCDLWNRLEVNIGERNAFSKQYNQVTLTTLNALKAEIQRCKILMKANLKKIVEKLRAELLDTWAKCHRSEDTRDEFYQFYHADAFTDDLLELHERELDKWKRYYAENEKLFTLLNEHKELWGQRIELERNSLTSNRFQNRGGQLLAEEKLRNKLSRRIPKLEQDLIKLAESFQVKHGRPFLTFGKTIEEYIQDLHAQHEDLKSQMSAKKQQQRQVTPGRSRFDLFAASPSMRMTPATSRRNLFAPPLTERSKRVKTAGGRKRSASAELLRPDIVKSRIEPKRQRVRPRVSRSASPNSRNRNRDENCSLASSYENFEQELAGKNCRSTGYHLTVPTAVPFKSPRKFLGELNF